MSTSHTFISIVHSYHHPHHNASYFVIILHRIRAEEENTSHKIMIKHLPWYQTLEIKSKISEHLNVRQIWEPGRLDLQIPHFVNILQLVEQFFGGSAIFGAMGSTFTPELPNCPPLQRAPEADLASNQLNSAPDALSQNSKSKMYKSKIQKYKTIIWKIP